MAADFKVAQPIEFYRKFLEQDVRPDGRELGEIRHTVLNIGSITTADGSALIKLGNTSVICGIKGELTVPKTEEPTKGFIVPNVELSPMCSPKFKPGPPSEQAQVLSQFVDDIMKSSKCVIPEDLCVVPGKLCWVLYCDLMCLDYDGNIIDACITALLAALTTVRLPTAGIDEETGAITTNLQKTLSIPIHSQPVSTTIATFDERVLLIDPTDEEETLSTGTLTVVTLADGQLCSIHKPGGTPLKPNQLQHCISRAVTRGVEVRRLIEETVNSLDR
ncbi:exosome complex component RRP43-like [Tubulanus polymorphus]|uniref:exosome complex component RRP43-like n=1 Tax=Tubulanus polymorphus TaxID=672921 RepID=UPI003DA6493A